MQHLDDATAGNINITQHSDPAPSTYQSTSAAAAPGHLPSQQQPIILHNTVGDEGWVPEEEIDEAFWEETMKNDWPTAVVQGNDQPHQQDAQPSVNNPGEDAASQDGLAALSNSYFRAAQDEAPQPIAGEKHASLDPLFDEPASEDNVEPTKQTGRLEPIQPGAEHFHFSPNPDYDPFASEDDDLVPDQQPPQIQAPQVNAGEESPSQNPLFNDLFADLVPELTPEALQELGASLGLSGDIANYRSSLDEQGPCEEQPAPAETAATGSKRKTADEEPSNGSKKVRLQEGPITYTPYQPRQDQRRVPTQQPRPQNHQRLPPYVSSSLAPPLAQGSLPPLTAAPEKPPTPGSTTLMPPPRRRPLPAEPLQPPPHTNPQHYGSQATPAKTPIADPTAPKIQRRQNLPPCQTQRPPFPASRNVQPTPTPTPPNAAPPSTTPRPISSQPTTSPSRVRPPPPAATRIDHRYTAPTTANQMALIITLLEPTITQFQNLMQGTPFAGHVIHTDMAASYVDQYQHIVRELMAVWGKMNWDRSALPRLRIVGPISGARWEGR